MPSSLPQQSDVDAQDAPVGLHRPEAVQVPALQVYPSPALQQSLEVIQPAPALAVHSGVQTGRVSGPKSGMISTLSTEESCALPLPTPSASMMMVTDVVSCRRRMAPPNCCQASGPLGAAPSWPQVCPWSWSVKRLLKPSSRIC